MGKTQCRHRPKPFLRNRLVISTDRKWEIPPWLVQPDTPARLKKFFSLPPWVLLCSYPFGGYWWTDFYAGCMAGLWHTMRASAGFQNCWTINMYTRCVMIRYLMETEDKTSKKQKVFVRNYVNGAPKWNCFKGGCCDLTLCIAFSWKYFTRLFYACYLWCHRIVPHSRDLLLRPSDGT